MTTSDHVRLLAAVLGVPEDDAAVRAAPNDYDALPPADAHSRQTPDAESAQTPDDVTFDPGRSSDPFNAFVSTFALADEERAGADDAPLAGLDVAVKDNVAVAGVPLTAGSRAFADATPARHAPVVARLLDAGATVAGKTNMDELAYGPTGETSAFGPTRNPRQDAHVAGGSSAGSGAAVAAGRVDAALGTDTGGSVRIPASFCGVVGYKPSFGAVPRAGVVPLAPSLDHVGVLATTVGDAARVADAIAGSHPSDPATAGRSFGGLASAAGSPPAVADCSFALAEEFLGPHVDPAVRGRVEGAVDALEAAGATVEHASVPLFAATGPAWDAVANVELAACLFAGLAPLGGVGVDDAWHADAAAALAEHADSQRFHDRVTANALDGAALLGEGGGTVYGRALAACRRFADGLWNALAGHDAVLAPTMPVTAPAVGEWPLSPGHDASRDERAGDAREHSDRRDADDRPPLSVNVRQANLVGAPAISVPCGRERGLPVGLQLLGRPGEDAALLGAASAVEAALDA